MVLITSGCQSQASHSARGNPDIDQMDRAEVVKAYRDLEKQADALKNDLAARELDYTKRTAELQAERENNRILNDELNSSKSDLEYVEHQFINIENTLTQPETKASAVAALAEAQLVFDKARREHPESLDPKTLSEVKSKIATAEEVTNRENYAAAVYYATRALRILKQSERRHTAFPIDGVTRIVAVSIANMRDGPGAKYKILDQLPYGTLLVQTEKKDDWFHVRTHEGEEGWMHASLLR